MWDNASFSPGLPSPSTANNASLVEQHKRHKPGSVNPILAHPHQFSQQHQRYLQQQQQQQQQQLDEEAQKAMGMGSSGEVTSMDY